MPTKRFKKFLVALCVFCLFIPIVVGGITIHQYSKVKSLCNQIKAGESINTTISNAMTAPSWFDGIAAVMQIDGPKIPLVEACYYRNVQAVEVLLENGANPNVFFDGRFSPLEAAIVYGPVDESSLAIVKLLLEHGADVNQFGSEAPLLIKLTTFLAAGNQNPIVQEMVLLLVRHNADGHWNGYNRAVFDIVKSGHVNLASAYFDINKHDVEELNNEGQSLLIATIINQQQPNALEMVKLLLECGIDIHTVDSKGYTAYDYAMQYKLYEIADIVS